MHVRCYLAFYSRSNNFVLGKDITYKCLFIGVMQTTSTPRTVRLRHYDNGPFLEVDYTQFDPTDKYQINVLTKNSSGWHIAKTSAYCLTDTSIDMSEYTKECIEYALREACESLQLESSFFQITSYYRDVSATRIKRHYSANIVRSRSYKTVFICTRHYASFALDSVLLARKL